MMWTVVLALLPAVLSSIALSGFDAFRIVTVAMLSSILSELAARKVFCRDTVGLYDGSAVVVALLFALLVPPSLPSWAAALGSAFAIIFGREIFGGLGQNPFNPALVGIAFLLVSFPSLRDVLLRLPQTIGTERIYSIAVLLGGLVLILKRVIYWEVPVIYMGVFLAVSLGTGQLLGEVIFTGSVLLAAFFMVTDPVTTPLTRLGTRWFAFGAGILTAVISEWISPVEAVTYGILLMNALNPHLDHWLRPSGARVKLR